MTTKIREFTQYRRKQIAELRPYIEGEDVSHVSISQEDAKAGSPKRGDMIARNPKNHADQWLVAHAYFLDNFEPLSAEQTQPLRVRVKPLVWEHHPTGLVASTGGNGEAYIIDTRTARHVYFLKGMDPNREYPSVEAAKTAAQADYERRILSALEPADPTPSSFYFPVPMPLDADGKGPASFERGEVRKLVFEVWDQDFHTHGTFDSLLDAIAHANRLNTSTERDVLAVENERLRKALKEILDLSERPYDEFPADWTDQIAACPECQRYKDHPIQQGICDYHRKPLYDRDNHNRHETSMLGYRAKSIAREALAARRVREGGQR